jgi:hypothetical protein
VPSAAPTTGIGTVSSSLFKEPLCRFISTRVAEFSDKEPSSSTIFPIYPVMERKGIFCVVIICITLMLVLLLIIPSLSAVPFLVDSLTDPYRKTHVIRIRAESDQFLLSCQRIETFIHWLQSLFTAIDLALPLDERELPQDLSVPRRQRRLAQHPSSTDAHETLLRNRNDVIPAGHGSGVTTPSDGPNTTSMSTGTVEPVSRNTTSRVVLNITRTRPTGPSISPETGKWQPDHGWSARKDMIYAKHCMAVLLSRSPRKSNLIIIKGKQWVVDWETGKLTRCDPPDYAEIENDRRVEGVSRSRKDPRS